MTLARPKFPAIYKVKPGNGVSAWQKHFAEEADKIISLKCRAEEFQNKVASETIKRKFGGHITTDFTVFPTIEMKKVYINKLILIWLNTRYSVDGYCLFPQVYFHKNCIS